MQPTDYLELMECRQGPNTVLVVGVTLIVFWHSTKWAEAARAHRLHGSGVSPFSILKGVNPSYGVYWDRFTPCAFMAPSNFSDDSQKFPIYKCIKQFSS
jgi:hypothetical protein